MTKSRPVNMSIIITGYNLSSICSSLRKKNYLRIIIWSVVGCFVLFSSGKIMDLVEVSGIRNVFPIRTHDIFFAMYFIKGLVVLFGFGLYEIYTLTWPIFQ